MYHQNFPSTYSVFYIYYYHGNFRRNLQKDILDYAEFLNDMYSIYKSINFDIAEKVAEKMDKKVYSVNILVPENNQ